ELAAARRTHADGKVALPGQDPRRRPRKLDGQPAQGHVGGAADGDEALLERGFGAGLDPQGGAAGTGLDGEVRMFGTEIERLRELVVARGQADADGGAALERIDDRLQRRLAQVVRRDRDAAAPGVFALRQLDQILERRAAILDDLGEFAAAIGDDRERRIMMDDAARRQRQWILAGVERPLDDSELLIGRGARRYQPVVADLEVAVGEHHLDSLFERDRLSVGNGNAVAETAALLLPAPQLRIEREIERPS